MKGRDEMNNTGLYKKMIRMNVVPILVLGIMIMVFSFVRFTNIIYARAEEDMVNEAHSVMMAYDIFCSGNYYPVQKADGTTDFYKGDLNLTGDCSIIDRVSGVTGDEISLLYMDVRVNTTFRGPDGQRLAGVSTNADTSERVLNTGQIVQYENVKMFNDKYLVVYVPLTNEDGSIVGMVEVAKSSTSMRSTVGRAVMPMILFVVVGMLLATFLAYRSTREITGVLSGLKEFLNKVAGGNLSTELDINILKRKDELGEIAKSTTSMQKSIRSFVESDPLTKLGNRRYFLNQTERVIARSHENNQPFSIAIADIDFFKKVNDTYGHNAGDEVLKAVANELKQSMMGCGFAARWGGEEFVLCFNKMGMYDASTHLWKTLEKIREMTIRTEGYDIKVTLTFGVVEGYQTTIEKLVEEADEKLYYGKQNGRNRVVTEIEKPEDESGDRPVEIEIPPEAADIREKEPEKPAPSKKRTSQKPKAGNGKKATPAKS